MAGSRKSLRLTTGHFPHIDHRNFQQDSKLVAVKFANPLDKNHCGYRTVEIIIDFIVLLLACFVPFSLDVLILFVGTIKPHIKEWHWLFGALCSLLDVSSER